ncbi:hypothetical protein FOMG_19479 [Fusarium oxysporum f. sp. melonis 26406]|uniref:Uncharacterized protein n=1 Tax=Fusarium oxysporum f. sp. melonis 26406 TaxID=1089452 RepID=W9ZRL0_FUSOX|nr:hypothetical protein FOMG_19479 [Fusarium oxysporum f. sp. melonis 26406]
MSTHSLEADTVQYSSSLPPSSSQHCPPQTYPLVQEYHQRQQQHQHQHPPQQHPQQQHPHPPPSPAHPAYHPYPPYGPRDPPIKGRPAEDGCRSNSTGHAPEGMPSTSHPLPRSMAPPPPPGAYSDSPPRHMNYEVAPSMPPTPDGYRAPSFPPPTPVPHQTPYEPHGGYPYPSTPHEPFYSVYSTSIPAKKKNTRASQVRAFCDLEARKF